jgi:flagellar export protein FliJ
MSSRRFRLASVLGVRRAQEESARLDLWRGNRRVQEATADRERSEFRYRTVPVSEGAIPASVFLREQVTAEMAAATLAEAVHQLSRARSDAALAQQRWSQAARRVEALERLARRRHDEVMADEARAESASVDDLVTARWIAAENADATNRGMVS